MGSAETNHGNRFSSQFRLARYSLPVILIQVVNIFMEGQILLYFFGTHFEQQQDPNAGEWFRVEVPNGIILAIPRY